jgi:hypothetical protein
LGKSVLVFTAKIDVGGQETAKSIIKASKTFLEGAIQLIRF